MNRNLSRCLFLALLLALPVIERPISAQFTPPPNPGGGGSGGTCSYCDLDACGCASRARCYIVFSCTCSPIQCTRSCDYKCF